MHCKDIFLTALLLKNLYVCLSVCTDKSLHLYLKMYSLYLDKQGRIVQRNINLCNSAVLINRQTKNEITKGSRQLQACLEKQCN